jgi:hypothetical protein
MRSGEEPWLQRVQPSVGGYKWTGISDFNTEAIHEMDLDGSVKIA